MNTLSRLDSSLFRCAPVVVAAVAGMLFLSAAGAAPETDGYQGAVAQTADDAGQAALAQDALAQWPMQVSDGARTFLIYQPQIDRWDNNRLEGRSAVSVLSADGRQNFGVLYFSARTQVDAASRMVIVSDAVASKADFPALGSSEEYRSILGPQLAAKTWRIARDRLQSDMQIEQAARQAEQQPLRNDPPRILYSERAALLVPIDGAPVLRPVAQTSLARVTNTRALLLQDQSTSTYFLYVADHWVQAPGLDGPWLATPNPSPQLEQAKQAAVQQEQVDLLQPESADAAALPAAPAIFVATTPTELLQTDGSPQYAPIERTQLLYVTNSPNKLFLDLRTQEYYALISGRWYRATALESGQWRYVAPASLPADFAQIPSTNPTESVRAAVPGTPQAREAVIANSVPQTAAVNRSATQLQIAYDGNPVFQPIEGTILQNAVNAPLPVIRIGEDAFYALSNGVWFVASSPFGPWAVATDVPAVIYSIPPSSPLHYVTYVRVYDATPQVVYVGYTPGYVGSYVSDDSVVVYGTGWPYRPWIGSVWYGAPVTWGFGFSFCYSWWHPYPWYGWHRTVWLPPRPYYRPWWGPWHAPAYAHARPSVVTAGRDANGWGRPGSRNVGHIYDRWDRRSVTAQPSYPRMDHAFAQRQPQGGALARSANSGSPRWVEGRREAPQFRSGAAAPPVQLPWRPRHDEQRGRVAPAPRQIAPRAAAGSERHSDNRFDNRFNNRFDNRPAASAPERARAQVEQFRPAPHQQWHQRIPPVAGVPVERPGARVQRVEPARSFSAPPRIERPASMNVGRGIERPQIERPQMSSGRAPERSFSRAPAGGHAFRGGGGSEHGGGGHR